VQLEYSTDLFDDDRIARMLGHLATLLEGVAADPDRPLSRLPLLSAAERATVRERVNDTVVPYPRDLCVAELFERQAARCPDATAVAASDAVLTYAALDARANQLAHHLQKAAVGPDVPVAIAMERSADLIVAVLAVLKAGGAYVPLDPDYPKARLAWMLADAEAPVLITQAHLAARLPAHAATLVVVDDPEQRSAIAACPQTRPTCRAGAGNLAYLMYTSGSTGHPKGVMVEHRAITRLVFAQSYFVASGRERFLQFAPISFDASTFEIWGALLNGAALVVVPPGYHSLDRLAEVIATQGVTAAWLTASLFNQFVHGDIGSLRCLRRLLTGGDIVSAASVRVALKKTPWCAVVNGYGPTETTTFACCHNITETDAPVPIGRPIANTRVYILDTLLEPMPIGVPGELYIGGEGVARGYWRREDLTAERFLADPFRHGGRLYRTGDLARYRGDGAIEFLGRRDDQVKIRGFRIEPGEVEAALGEHPDVRAAAVVARPADGDEKQLVAYAVPAGARRPAAEELRGFLAQRLPDYMIPAAFVLLDRLPVTLNGKLDRARLPAPTTDRPQLDTAYAAPATELERRIATIWRRLLDRSEVGVNDNFFDLGAHSLLMVRAQRALQEDLASSIKLVDMFEFPTIRTLARHLAGAATQATPASTPAFPAIRERVRKQQQALKQRCSRT